MGCRKNIETTGIPVVDGDKELARLDAEIQALYSSYYKFDSHDQACWFNEEREREDKEKMLALLAALNQRLSEVNDGSFAVDDQLTSYFSAL